MPLAQNSLVIEKCPPRNRSMRDGRFGIPPINILKTFRKRGRYTKRSQASRFRRFESFSWELDELAVLVLVPLVLLVLGVVRILFEVLSVLERVWSRSLSPPPPPPP